MKGNELNSLFLHYLYLSFSFKHSSIKQGHFEGGRF